MSSHRASPSAFLPARAFFRRHGRRVLGVCAIVLLASVAGRSRAAEAPIPAAAPHASTPLPAAEPATVRRTAVAPLPLGLAWSAPFGAPGARRALTAACWDTSRVDTMFLSFATGAHTVALAGVSAAIAFEPAPGESLGTFWGFERTGTNPGSLLVDFDLLTGVDFDTPWATFVSGHVGYSHPGQRGRLDVSADVPIRSSKILAPHTTFCFARIRITHARTTLTGCGAPMAITWVGGLLHLSDGTLVHCGPSPTITWNAGRRTLPRRRVNAAIETWVPVVAPPSQVSLAPHAEPTVEPSVDR